MEKENYYNIRRANIYDWSNMKTCLEKEGLVEERHSFKTDNTYVCDLGFFTWRLEHNTPRLVHFYLSKINRGVKGAYGLFRLFEKVMRHYGYFRFIGASPVEQPELEKFLRHLGGEFYAETGGEKFYTVKVGGYEGLH